MLMTPNDVLAGEAEPRPDVRHVEWYVRNSAPRWGQAAKAPTDGTPDRDQIARADEDDREHRDPRDAAGAAQRRARRTHRTARACLDEVETATTVEPDRECGAHPRAAPHHERAELVLTDIAPALQRPAIGNRRRQLAQRGPPSRHDRACRAKRRPTTRPIASPASSRNASGSTQASAAVAVHFVSTRIRARFASRTALASFARADFHPSRDGAAPARRARRRRVRR